jgi:hypothetical protein
MHGSPVRQSRCAITRPRDHRRRPDHRRRWWRRSASGAGIRTAGRQWPAWLGLHADPAHSSGGRSRLGTISCRGDTYLRAADPERNSLQRAKAVQREGRRTNPDPVPVRTHCRSASCFPQRLPIKHARGCGR